MQIIFDQKLVPELRQKYVVLELDTVKQPAMTEPVVLHALIEHLDINDLQVLDKKINTHEKLVKDYKSNNFLNALADAESLRGSWQGQLDEFYDLVIKQCNEMIAKKETWNGILYITPKEHD